MGDPKKITNKFQKPNHPWQKERIDAERILSKKYGLRNKKELWKMDSLLKGYKNRTKQMFVRSGVQAEKERQQLIQRMKKYGLITQNSLDEILGLPIEAIMDRRLQSIVMKRKLSRGINHARQLIIHEHIVVNGKKITSPGYLVSVVEESTVSYSSDSPLMNPDHPEKYVEKELKDAAEAKEQSAKKKVVEKVVEIKPKPAPEKPPIDPLEATKSEDLEHAPIIVKEDETIKEKIQDDIDDQERVAEGKPALSDEKVEEQDETGVKDE